MNVTGWSRGLEVTADGQGIVSHSGLVLLRLLADRTGLAAGLSRALATLRLLVHDRGRLLADLAAAIADGAEVISDFAVMQHQEQLLGPVASVPTAWRMLNEVAGGGPRVQARITRQTEAGRDQVLEGLAGRALVAVGDQPGTRRVAWRAWASSPAAAWRFRSSGLPGTRMRWREPERGVVPYS